MTFGLQWSAVFHYHHSHTGCILIKQCGPPKYRSLYTHPNSNIAIGTKFCTCRGSVACAKVCCDTIAKEEITATRNFCWIWILIENRYWSASMKFQVCDIREHVAWWIFTSMYVVWENCWQQKSPVGTHVGVGNCHGCILYDYNAIVDIYPTTYDGVFSIIDLVQCRKYRTGFWVWIGVGLVINRVADKSWWRHDMGTLSPFLTIFVGNPPMTGGFLSQRASNEVIWCFVVLHVTKTVE